MENPWLQDVSLYQDLLGTFSTSLEYVKNLQGSRAVRRNNQRCNGYQRRIRRSCQR
jgi:hypothetical protein